MFSGPFTVFAPTDAALGGFNANDYTKEQLAKLLQYHVITDFVLLPMISSPTNKTTWGKQSLELAPSGSVRLYTF